MPLLPLQRLCARTVFAWGLPGVIGLILAAGPPAARGAGVYPLPILLPETGGPRAVAVGDFDSDGRADLAVATPLTERVALHFSSSGGGFPSTRSFAVEGLPAGMDAADIDGDGRADLVWADERSGGYGMLRQLPTSPVTFELSGQGGSDEAIDLRAVDVDGDGWVDVVVAHRGADLLSWYRNVLGRLQAVTPLRAGDGPTRVVPLRLATVRWVALLQTGVLSQDLVVQDPVSGVVHTRLSLGSPAGLDAFDLDDDGVDEIVTTDASTGRVTVFRRRAPDDWGEFAAGVLRPGTSAVLALRDTGRRGDLLVVEGARHRASLMRRQGGSLVELGGWFVGEGVDRVVAVDPEGDGVDAYAFALPLANATLVVEREGDRLLAPEAVPTGNGPLRVEVVAIDATRQRMFVLCPGEPELAVYEIESGVVRRVASLACASSAVAMEVEDLDGTGPADVAILEDDAGIRLYFDDGGGPASSTQFLPASGVLRDLEAIDVLGDASRDLVVSDQTAGVLRVFERFGGGYRPAPDLSIDVLPRQLEVGDLDLDGFEDLVLAGDDTGLRLYFGRGDSLSGPTPFAVGNQPRDLGLGFFNGDEFPDIVVANSGDGTFAVLTSSFRGVYSPTIRGQFTPDGAQNLVVLDFDGNGFDDLFFASPISPTVSYHANTATAANPTAAFTLPLRTRAAVRPVDFAAADLDGDGTGDLVVLDGSGAIAVLLRSDPRVGLPAMTAVASGHWTEEGFRLQIDSDASDASLLRLVRLPEGERLALEAGGAGRWIATDPAATADTAYEVRDVRGRVLARTHTVVAPAAAESRRDRLRPVVWRGDRADIAFRVGGSGAVRVRLYDLRGRQVDELSSRPAGDGWWFARWNGRDFRGRPVARGRYLVEVRRQERRLQGTVTVFR